VLGLRQPKASEVMAVKQLANTELLDYPVDSLRAERVFETTAAHLGESFDVIPGTGDALLKAACLSARNTPVRRSVMTAASASLVR